MPVALALWLAAQLARPVLLGSPANDPPLRVERNARGVLHLRGASGWLPHLLLARPAQDGLVRSARERTGAWDLVLGATAWRLCGNSAPSGFLRVLSGRDGERVDGAHGPWRFECAVATHPGRPRERVDEWVLARLGEFEGSLEGRSRLAGEPRWQITDEALPWVACTALAFVSDSDGDDRDELAVANPEIGMDGGYEGRGTHPGAVALLSGARRSLLWQRFGTADRERFGSALAAVADVDGDGAGELAVLVRGAAGSRLELMRTRDGATLASIALPSLSLDELRVLDDVDGDGVAELAAGGQCVVSLGAGERLRLGQPGVEWIASLPSAREGGAELLLGVRTTLGAADVPQQRMLRWSPAGVRELRQVPGADLDWRGARALTADFDGDGRTDLALCAGEHAGPRTEIELVLVPGALLE